jgi:hypothetical protein
VPLNVYPNFTETTLSSVRVGECGHSGEGCVLNRNYLWLLNNYPPSGSDIVHVVNLYGGQIWQPFAPDPPYRRFRLYESEVLPATYDVSHYDAYYYEGDLYEGNFWDGNVLHASGWNSFRLCGDLPAHYRGYTLSKSGGYGAWLSETAYIEEVVFAGVRSWPENTKIRSTPGPSSPGLPGMPWLFFDDNFDGFSSRVSSALPLFVNGSPLIVNGSPLEVR